MRNIVEVDGITIYIFGSMGLAFRGPTLLEIAHVGSVYAPMLYKPRAPRKARARKDTEA